MANNQILKSITLPDGRRLHVVWGDITHEVVDAVVNAANSTLEHGGGVAGAIVRRGGREIQEESRAWIREHGPVSTGSAAITGAGRLPARWVIHAVGPVWRGTGDEGQKLAAAVKAALSLADAHNVRSISLPAISSGIFGFPKPQAVRVIWRSMLDYFLEHPDSSITDVRFCNIDLETAELFRAEAERFLSHSSSTEIT
ncbi:MAG TPA: macro domain-containing protein [Chloroflexi bacterium]|nr:macro domain-containing protein [Chloroflexota bacterium]